MNALASCAIYAILLSLLNLGKSSVSWLIGSHSTLLNIVALPLPFWVIP